jgi:hypothetical protein
MLLRHASGLDIDIVRDWNLDQADTWGAVGHFSIASRVGKLLSSAVPRNPPKWSPNSSANTSTCTARLLQGRHLRLFDHADLEYSMLPGLPRRTGAQVCLPGHLAGSRRCAQPPLRRPCRSRQRHAVVSPAVFAGAQSEATEGKAYFLTDGYLTLAVLPQRLEGEVAHGHGAPSDCDARGDERRLRSGATG